MGFKIGNKASKGRPHGAVNKTTSLRIDVKTEASIYHGMKGIYVIRCGQSNYYKIGRTSNLSHRLDNLMCGNPYPIILCKFITSNHNGLLEKGLHKILKDYRHQGEWFELSDKIFSLVMTVNCVEDLNRLQEYLKPNLFTVLN